MAECTPGPWHVKGKDIFDGDGGLVAMVTDSYERGKAARDRDKADRRLIAAAPDLLAVAKAFIAALDGEHTDYHQLATAARAAIASATRAAQGDSNG